MNGRSDMAILILHSWLDLPFFNGDISIEDRPDSGLEVVLPRDRGGPAAVVK
jgi:hypothetical protein